MVARSYLIDWCKDSGQWNIKDVDSRLLMHKAKSIRFNCPGETLTTDGGKHGYLMLVADTLHLDCDHVAHFTLKGQTDGKVAG